MASSPNKRLQVRARLNAFRRTQLRQGERLGRSRDEHEAIVEAITECDGEQVSRRIALSCVGDDKAQPTVDA